MSEDPFEKAGKIRRGELDDEMPSFDELSGWLQRAPMTWLPALFHEISEQCKAKQVFQEDKTDSQHVANLVLLVGRLVRQVRKSDPTNDVAEKAMDYLRRSDLIPSITRGVTENVSSQANGE